MFVANMASHCSGVIDSRAAVSKAPALLISRSSPPRNSAPSAMARCTDAGSVTSISTAPARTPWDCSADTACSAAPSIKRVVSTTSAPACARACASPAPMRRTPPVTTTRLPASKPDPATPEKIGTSCWAANPPLCRPPWAMLESWSCSVAWVPWPRRAALHCDPPARSGHHPVSDPRERSTA